GGGWRLWTYDRAGDGFYYAHLSGYTALALHRRYVKAGQLLGFVGDTGDADGGAAHLHFEVHPASLRYLGEDGAVDPTGYLQSWRRVQHVLAARPLHPAMPAGWAGQAAERTFRALLAVRPAPRRVTRRPHRFVPPVRLFKPDPQPIAVITGVIKVVPAGGFHLLIGWRQLLSPA